METTSMSLMDEWIKKFWYTHATSWTVAHQAFPTMGFSRQEYWSGLPVPSPGDLPNPWIEPRSPTLQADALTSDPPGKPTHMHTHTQIVFSHKREGNLAPLTTWIDRGALQ